MLVKVVKVVYLVNLRQSSKCLWKCQSKRSKWYIWSILRKVLSVFGNAGQSGICGQSYAKLQPFSEMPVKAVIVVYAVNITQSFGNA